MTGHWVESQRFNGGSSLLTWNMGDGVCVFFSVHTVFVYVCVCYAVLRLTHNNAWSVLTFFSVLGWTHAHWRRSNMAKAEGGSSQAGRTEGRVRYPSASGHEALQSFITRRRIMIAHKSVKASPLPTIHHPLCYYRWKCLSYSNCGLTCVYPNRL